jgi:hypothetical protein
MSDPSFNCGFTMREAITIDLHRAAEMKEQEGKVDAQMALREKR